MIFLSFSSKNIEQVKKIYNSLKISGLPVWFSVDSVKSGESYAKKILNAIQNASCLVLVYSSDTDDSSHIHKELDLAIKYKKKIYPLRIRDDEPQEGMEYFLSGVQYKDIFNNYKKEMKDFILFLKDQLGLKEDSTQSIDSKSIKNFCIQHFKQMGYTIGQNNSNFWKNIPEVKGILKKESSLKNKLISYLMDEAIYCTKENTRSLIVIPKFLDSITVPYFKAYEAELFWNIRFFIWDREDLLEAYEVLKIDTSSDDIDFKKKSSLVDIYKSLNGTKKKFSLLFYLFVKQAPVYNFTKNYPLPFKTPYTQGEQMPNLYLDYTYISDWWGYGKDDIESIPGKRYIGFTESYEKLKYSFKDSSKVTYEQYNGRVAETLAEVFLKRNNLVVQKFGVESILGNSLSFMERSDSVEDSFATDTIKRFMSSPDLLSIKLNTQNQIINSYMIDVKYRSFRSKEIFLNELKNGELYNQASKYSQNWNHIYLFLFLHLKDKNIIEIYLLPVQDILQNGFEPTLIQDDITFGWLENDEIELLYNQAINYWIKG